MIHGTQKKEPYADTKQSNFKLHSTSPWSNTPSTPWVYTLSTIECNGSVSMPKITTQPTRGMATGSLSTHRVSDQWLINELPGWLGCPGTARNDPSVWGTFWQYHGDYEVCICIWPNMVKYILNRRDYWCKIVITILINCNYHFN